MLIIYDSEVGENFSQKEREKSVKVVLIDFSHVYKNTFENSRTYDSFLSSWDRKTGFEDEESFKNHTLDYNIIYGLEKIKNYLLNVK